MQRTLTPFFILRFKAGYGDDDKAADLCGVTIQTIRRWDKHGAPTAIKTLFKILSLDLGWIDPKWAGFRFHGGLIYTPANEALEPWMIQQFRSIYTGFQELLRNETQRAVQHRPPVRALH